MDRCGSGSVILLFLLIFLQRDEFQLECFWKKVAGMKTIPAGRSWLPTWVFWTMLISWLGRPTRPLPSLWRTVSVKNSSPPWSSPGTEASLCFLTLLFFNHVVVPEWFIPDPDPALNFPNSGSNPCYLSTLYLEIVNKTTLNSII